MPFLSSFSGHTPDGFLQSKQRSLFIPTTGYSQPGQPYKDNWDVERGIKDGLEKVTWAYKAAYAIAANASRLPVNLRKQNSRNGEIISSGNAILDILNKNANHSQDAFTFRFMLSQQILLSKKGAFVEVVRNKVDDIVGLHLLPPHITYPIPDKKNYVSGYVMEVSPGNNRFIDKDSVIWIKVPHPTDPYKGQTPLEAAGLALEFDYYSKVYNRNFVVNDNRPGGILIVNGDMEDEQAEEVKRRFQGTTGSNIGGAGRLTVMSAESASYLDVATSQRDAQYIEARAANKEEILIAFGVPESILGNASGRTFSNSDVEMDIFWRETMLPHLTLIERSFDSLDPDPDTFISHDLSSVAVLDRDNRERSSFHLDELKQGAISIDEYRLLTGRNPVGIKDLLVPTNLSPMVLSTSGNVVAEDISDAASPSNRLNPAQRPGRPPKSPDSASGSVTDNAVPPSSESGPNPIPVNSPTMNELSLEIEETKEDDGLAEKRFRHIQRLETSVAIQLASSFKRQRRVIMEKASSRKVKEKWESGGISVSDIFDASIWNEQFVEDAKTWVSACFIDGMIEIDGISSVNNSGNLNNPNIASIIDSRSKKMELVNQTTKSFIEKLINNMSSETHEKFLNQLDVTLTENSQNRIKAIARTEVTGSFNLGMVIAAKAAGFTKKKWIPMSDDNSRHNHSNIGSSTIGIDDMFVLDGKSLNYPGDVDGGPADVINCRCTIKFS
jgi:HK97 family phage portal protein